MTRCARFAAYMNQCKPDLIGTQEMNIYWYKALQTTLPDYDAYGVQRGGDATDWNSEMNPVFWNKTKYTALEKNTFWLSETPNKASRYTYTDENGQPGQAGLLPHLQLCGAARPHHRQTAAVSQHPPG